MRTNHCALRLNRRRRLSNFYSVDTCGLHLKLLLRLSARRNDAGFLWPIGYQRIFNLALSTFPSERITLINFVERTHRSVGFSKRLRLVLTKKAINLLWISTWALASGNSCYNSVFVEFSPTSRLTSFCTFHRPSIYSISCKIIVTHENIFNLLLRMLLWAYIFLTWATTGEFLLIVWYLDRACAIEKLGVITSSKFISHASFLAHISCT